MNNKNDDNVLNFMQITECQDYTKAENYMKMANNNLEMAISLYMEIEGPNQNITPQNSTVNPRQAPSQISEEQKYVQEVNTQIFNAIHPPRLQSQSSAPIPQENQIRIEEYRKYLKDKEDHEEGFPKKIWNGTIGFAKSLCTSTSSLNKLVTKQKDNGAEFISFLSKNRVAIQIQFATGNFLQNLEKTQQNFKPLILYVHHPSSNSYFKDILNHPQLVSFINKMYQSLGFLFNSEGVQQLKEQNFPMDKAPAFYVFRRDIFEKVILMSTYEILPDTDCVSLMGRLKTDKANFNKQYIIEEQIKKEATTSQRDAYISQQQFFAPPPLVNQGSSQEPQITQAQKQQQQIRLQQERDLRQQQEAAFRLAEEESKKKFQQKKEEELLNKKKEEELQRQQEEKLFMKATQLSNLPNEPQPNDPNVVFFSFRMPNGSNIERRFKDDTQIEVLFTFISCQEEQYFENPDGEFDIIQNFPRLSLLERKNELVNQVFIDSQMEQVIVKEL